ncbi:hypothetical protein ABBQ38_005218 [Trebouxia sp. C0009 RCD-2024]
MAQADRARQKAFGRLDTFLDENGGINDPAKAGAFANFMRLMRQDSAEQMSFTVWQAQLQAVARTARTLTLTKLATAPDLVPTLAAMLKAAEQHQQISFIRQLLQALRKLPFPWAMLEGSDLLKRVLHLQKHRLPRVASAAAAIARHWQQLGGLGGLPFAIPAMHPSSRPSKGSMPPPAHLMAPMGKFNAGTHPGAQRASIPGSREGQGLLLQQGQDQRLLHPGEPQGVAHSDELLAASQSSGSHAPTDSNGSGPLSQQGVRQANGNAARGALGPAQAYTRGFVPRKRANMGPAKPLSADEIVKANAKKRANGVQMGAPAKIGRLDAATMAALGKRGPASVLGQLPGQGTGPAAPARGRPQLPQQAGTQHAGGPGLGPGSSLTSGRGVASRGSLLSPAHGFGNLFNEEDVMSGPSSNHGHPMHTHQHQQPHQQPHHQQYGQGIPYQRLHGHNPPVHTPPSGQGPLMRFLPVGHTHLNQNLSEADVARMVPTVAWGPLVSLVPPALPDQSSAVPCAGEASTEADYQARREAVNPEVRYIMPEDVSPDPYEPYEVEELQQPAQPPAFLLPFVPIDGDERVKLSQKMADMGVTDPEHLSCAEPVDIVAHNPSPTELAPLDMISPNEYEVPQGFSATQVQDFGLTHAVRDVNAPLPPMHQLQHMYNRTYDQQWPQEHPDAFMMSSDAGLSHGNDAFRSAQHFGLPMQNQPGQLWH